MIQDNQVVIDKECTVSSHSHLCWSAVFSGALVGVGLGFLLYLFGIAIGLSAYSTTANGAAVIAIGGIIGLLIGVVASMGVSGFVAGYLGRFHHCFCHGGVMYGFVTWSLALVLSALLVIPLTKYVSFYKATIAPTVLVTGIPTAQGVKNVSLDQVGTTQTTEVTSRQLAGYGWVLFVLFFIGALASCIGACCGMACRKEQMHRHASSKQPPTTLS